MSDGMEKRWVFKEQPAAEAVKSLSQAINTNPILSTILLQRGISDFESAKNFFRPELSHLHDPFLMKDMDKAVARLHKAVATNERILIYGDYDVDGTTAVALVYSYLRTFYDACAVYIPDRYKEGYGVSLAGIEYAEANGYSLIIALDCGIKSSELVRVARSKGIDFIICDHHLPGDVIPDAVAVLDPKREDCDYPCADLSGCALGFKLLQGYSKTHRREEELYQYIDLVAVSIASDIVPIVDENRVLTYHGLRKLNADPMPGLKALKEIAGVKNDLDVSGVVFTLSPRINAAGRIAHARAAVDLLVAETAEESLTLANKLDLNNQARKEVDSSITEEALAMIEMSDRIRPRRSTVLFKEDWHKGVIGIVAARCIEKFYRPTVILTASEDKITGSARSVNGFDLYQAIKECGDLLEKFGGHKYAAGLTMDKQNLDAFKERFEEVVAARLTSEMLTPAVEVDTMLPLDAVNGKFVNVLKQMGPFGPGNPCPVFAADNLFVQNSLTVLRDRHVRFLVGQQGSDRVLQAIGFDMAHHYEAIASGRSFSMAFTVEENVYNGNTSIQLRIKDFKFDRE
jgi:single-stranded-DNA-specific exonuclease